MGFIVLQHSVRQIKRFIPARHNSGVAERAEGRGIAKRYVIEARVTSLPPIGPRGFLASETARAITFTLVRRTSRTCDYKFASFFCGDLQSQTFYV